ncbi:MAG TPA: peptidylprolyl isomerase [Candidatus Polarisedimenticolaceae bacterium]|nr:peptidylprolyl isomerase [Candidatus Polarisedimenticolaceae bacterium]
MKTLLAAVACTACVGISVAAPAEQAAGKKDKALSQIEQSVANAKVDKSNARWRTSVPKPTVASFEPGKTYFVRMETNKGTIKIKMLPEVAPMHVTNFLYLTKLGFYDGLSFHRVIPGFMAQGGCPLGTGTGDPGYRFDGEIGPKNKHEKGGLLSMANAGPGTDGSQFFLTFVPTSWLDKNHTIFGEVVEGMDTLKKLEAAGTQGGKPTEPLKMEKLTIEVQ